VPLAAEGDSVDSFSLQPKTRKQCIKIQISPKPLLPKPDRAVSASTSGHPPWPLLPKLNCPG